MSKLTLTLVGCLLLVLTLSTYLLFNDSLQIKIYNYTPDDTTTKNNKIVTIKTNNYETPITYNEIYNETYKDITNTTTKIKNVITTAAINTLQDPQFGVLWDDDKTYNVITQYINKTITHNVKDVHLVIFISSPGVETKLRNSDEMKNIIISCNINNVTIEVINVETKITTDKQLIGRVPNDLKFLLSYEYFKTHVDEINHVFIIDLDVTIHTNPFQFVANVDSATKKHNLYTQTEILKPYAFEWLSQFYYTCKFDQPLPKQNNYFYNCGIMGGKLKYLFLDFLKQYVSFMINAPKGALCDMSIHNYLVHYKYNDLAITGYPLHSVFTRHQQNDAFFWHK
eukprot:Pgem_evm1s5266